MICGPRCVEIGVSQCVVSVARPLRRARSGGGWGESSLGGELGSKRGGIGGNMSLCHTSEGKCAKIVNACYYKCLRIV